MWVGKIAIIMYIFSLALLFSGYYVDQISGLSLFTTVTVTDSNGNTSEQNTFDYLGELINQQSGIDESLLPDLIFGDFVTVARVIFGVITGEPVSAAFGMLPHFDEVWMLMVRIIFTLASMALWGYIIAGRVL